METKWNVQALVLAVAQLVIGAALAIAGHVTEGPVLTDLGMLLLGSAVGGAVLPGVRR